MYFKNMADTPLYDLSRKISTLPFVMLLGFTVFMVSLILNLIFINVPYLPDVMLFLVTIFMFTGLVTSWLFFRKTHHLESEVVASTQWLMRTIGIDLTHFLLFILKFFLFGWLFFIYYFNQYRLIVMFGTRGIYANVIIFCGNLGMFVAETIANINSLYQSTYDYLAGYVPPPTPKRPSRLEDALGIDRQKEPWMSTLAPIFADIDSKFGGWFFPEKLRKERNRKKE